MMRAAPPTTEPSPDALRTRVRDELRAAGINGDAHLLVAVSGGTDSLALLLLLDAMRTAESWRLSVAHVSHGISEAGRTATQLVERLCEARGLPCLVVRLALGAGASETRARAARHRALGRLRREAGADVIVLAHHRDDQVETVLLRALRGSGPAGLGGMRRRQGRVVRPLLGVPRSALAHVVAEAGLVPWEDPANADERHERSWVRHALLPMLEARTPSVRGALARLAAQAETDRVAWDSALEAIPELAWRDDGPGGSIVAAPLGRYDSGFASALLRALVRRAGGVLGPVRAARALAWIRAADVGGWMPIGGRWRLELVRGRVRAHRLPPAPRAWPALRGDVPGGADVGAWQLRWDVADAERCPRDGLVQFVPLGGYHLRAWRPGDRVRPLGGTGSRSVGRCLQDAGIGKGLRVGWPVLVADEAPEEIVWVVGVCRAAVRLPEPGTRSVRVTAERR